MSPQNNFQKKITTLVHEVEEFTEDTSPEIIETTAQRLEALNFTVPIITPLSTFLRLDKQGVIAEIQRIQQMDMVEACAVALDDELKCEDLRIQHITVLLYYYKKLITLRNGNPEEWDEIDELFVHD